jgi:hypothetical protein
MNGQEGDTSSSDCNSDQDIETHLHGVSEEDIILKTDEQTNINDNDGVQGRWTDKVDLAEREDKNSGEDGLVIEDLIVEDIDMNENKDDEDGLSLDAVRDDEGADSNQSLDDSKSKRRLERMPKARRNTLSRRPDIRLPQRKWKGLTKAHEDEDQPPHQVKPPAEWLVSRFALSKRSCRFELPIDMKRLETMSPLDYLCHFCIVDERRRIYYSEVFSKHNRSRSGRLTLAELHAALLDVHFKSVKQDQISNILKVASVSNAHTINYQEFIVLAALCERLLVTTFIKPDRPSASEEYGMQKSVLEDTDWSAWRWKLRGVNVRQDIRVE